MGWNRPLSQSLPGPDDEPLFEVALAAQAEGGHNMPTMLMIRGWRFFFYANERNWQVHFHG
jgi:hypothetical protein